MNSSRTHFKEFFPRKDDTSFIEVFEIWDAEVEKILSRMVELSSPHMNDLHINLKEEMIFQLANLGIWLNRILVEDRLRQNDVDSIAPVSEKAFFESSKGKERVENTAKNLSISWLKRYEIRWKPKSRAALEKEKNPPKNKLKIKPVNKNHFIPKSFIKRFWSENNKIWRYRVVKGNLEVSNISYGKWGFQRGLYSDKLEAYFGLIEGDATLPIQMLLDVIPLNFPQKESLIGFAVIQSLRHPDFIYLLIEGMRPLVRSTLGRGQAEDPMYMQRVYESLFQNNDFYDRAARPLFENMWILLKTENGEFILPDTFALRGANYLLMPINPYSCFVVIPYKQEEERIIPYQIKADSQIVDIVVNLLILNSSFSFLGPQEFSLPPHTNSNLVNELFLQLRSKVIQNYHS